jgi:multicomponent Na+:H+ antiporter subunit C
MNSADIFAYFGLAGLLVLLAGFYSVLVSDNLVRTVIAVEILTKAVTLLIIVAGYLTGQMGLAQAMAITLIIIEVALTAVAVGIILCIFKRQQSINADTIRTLKG